MNFDLEDTLEGAKTAIAILGLWVLFAAEAAVGLFVLALIVRLVQLILR